MMLMHTQKGQLKSIQNVRKRLGGLVSDEQDRGIASADD